MKVLSKLGCSVSSAILIALLSTGCAHHPLAQSWQWSKAERDADYQRISKRIFEEEKRRMERIRAEYPNWEKAVSDEVLIVECESTATTTYCVGR